MTIDHTTGNYYLLISCPNDVWRLMCSLVPKEKTGSTLSLSIVPKRCVQKYRTESKLSEDRRRRAKCSKSLSTRAASSQRFLERLACLHLSSDGVGLVQAAPTKTVCNEGYSPHNC